jgi:hypothetical protein
LHKRLAFASQSCAERARYVACLVGGLAAASSGCTNLSHYQPTHSGRLSDYSGLTEDGFHVNRGLGIQRNRSRNATPEDLDRIDSFYIEPTGWVVDAESRAGRYPVYRSALTADLDLALRDQLGPIRPIVARPGPRTARVRSVITDARLSRPYSNAGLLAAGAASGACGVPLPLGPIFFGGGCVEAEIIGPDDRQLAAITCASGGGLGDFFGFFSRASHARKAMQRAALELKETLVR